MICADCQHDNRSGRRFCAECGQPLVLPCPACGAANEPGEKFCGECGGSLTAAGPPTPREQASAARPAPSSSSGDGGARKVVSIIFADLVGSTALHERLDAESAQRLMDRYYDVLRAAVESAGGSVVKLLGDGVMAAFGLRMVAEDDALRAVRGAMAMQEAFASLAAERSEVLGESGLRVAVNTGEVVVSGDHDDLIGDPVNVAARLQDQGRSGDVVLGEATRRLVASQVTLAPLGSVTLKGRAEAVAAYRVVSLDPPAATAVAPFVGRDDELRRLGVAYEIAVGTPVARLAVLVGSPGLGKSRLIGEFTRRRAEEATILTAHCDAAGGTTFAPLARALRTLLGLGDGAASGASGDPSGDPSGNPSGNTVQLALTAAMASGVEESERARIVRGVAGLLDGSPAPPEETFFVVRRFLVALTTASPVVLVIDDLQWAEPLLLDLMEHLVQWSGNVPLFVLAGARPELRDLRSSLVVPGALVSDVVTLGGLDAGAAMRLAANVIGAADLPAAVAAKVLATSEGNPLFVSELVRMLVEEGALTKDGDRWIVGAELAALEMPPTIHALLAARIERLRPEERFVLERAAVVGRHFSRGSIAAMLDGGNETLDARLEVLTRSELIERDSGWFLGEPALRFHHLLIRDAAYRRLLKGTRAELHARLAQWLEVRVGQTSDQDETIGRHLEQAHLLLRELGPLDEAARVLGDRAAARLAAAGRRALARDDLGLAANLLGRAHDCHRRDDPLRADLILDWCEALLAGGDVGPASAAIEELAGLDAESERLRAWRACFASQLSVLTEPENLQTAADAVAEAAAVLERLEDPAGQAKAHSVHAAALVRLGRVGDCEAALDRALAAARQAGDRRRANAVLAGAPIAALWGPSPVTRASGRCLDVVRVLRITQGAPAVEAVALACQGVLEALRGRIDAARRMVASARKMVEELGIAQRLFESDVFAARIELLKQDPAAAEHLLRKAYDGLRDLGLGIDAARAGALLARTRLLQNDAAEAEALSHQSELLAGDDLQAAIAWRGVRAEALAKRGEHAAAIELAQTAVAIAAATDALLDHADARLALAATLRAAGRKQEAEAEERHAMKLWEAKGATLLVERTRGDQGTPAAAGQHDPTSLRPEQRSVRSNAATEALARGDAAIASRDLAASVAVGSADYVETDHRLGVTYGRSGLEASMRGLFQAEGTRLHQDPLATLGDSLALARRSLHARSQISRHFDIGAFENEAVVVVHTDPQGLLRRQEVFAPAHLDRALACLYRWHAEELPEGSARDRALAASAAVTALQGAFEAERIAAVCRPDVQVHDHRRVGFGTLQGVDALAAAVRATLELSDRLIVQVRDVLFASDDTLAMLCASAGTIQDGDDFERPACEVWFFAADGRIARWERFEAEDQIRALTLLGQHKPSHGQAPPHGRKAPAGTIGESGAATAMSHPGEPAARTATLDPRFGNAATRLNERITSAWNSGDPVALEALHSPSVQTQDRRRLLRTDLSTDETFGNLRFLFEIPNSRVTVTPLATRGERLALSHLLIHGEVPEGGGEMEMELLSLDEVDEKERSELVVFFDPEDIEAAYAELDTRYQSRGASSISASATVFGRFIRARDWDALEELCAPEFVQHDHRGFAVVGTIRGPKEWARYFRALVELAPDSSPRFRNIRNSSRGYLAQLVWEGSRDGGQYEIPLIVVIETDSQGRFLRGDLYDDNQLDDAFARLAQIQASEITPDQFFVNAATRMSQAAFDSIIAGDFDLESRLAPDFRFADRRRIAHLETGKDGFHEFRQLVVRENLDIKWAKFEMLATRGERLALTWKGFEYEVGDSGVSQTVFLDVVELNEDGACTALVRFDESDLEAAYQELDERWAKEVTTEADLRRFSTMQSARRRAWDDFVAGCAHDFHIVDHRLLGWGTTLSDAATFVRSQEALSELSPDVQSPRRHARQSDRGYLWVGLFSGTRDGGPFEIPFVNVTESDAAGQFLRMDVYDPDQLGLALQRFAELGAPKSTAEPQALPDAANHFANEAWRIGDRMRDCWMQSDWEGFLAFLAPDFRFLDHQSIAHLDLDRTAYLEFTRQIGVMESRQLRIHRFGTRGERLVLTKFQLNVADGDIGPSVLEYFNIIESDEHGRAKTFVRYGASDGEAAWADLDARYQAGEGSQQIPRFSCEDSFVGGMNRRDWSVTEANFYAPEFVAYDQRLAGYGTLHGGADHLRAVRAMIELAPDARLRMLHMKSVGRVMFSEMMWHGTRDGGAFESPFLSVFELNKDGLVVRQDIYDPQHFDRAKARFEEACRAQQSDHATPS